MNDKTKPAETGGFFRTPEMRLFGDLVIHGIAPRVIGADADDDVARHAFLSGVAFMAAAAETDPSLAAKIVALAGPGYEEQRPIHRIAASHLSAIAAAAANPSDVTTIVLDVGGERMN